MGQIKAQGLESSPEERTRERWSEMLPARDGGEGQGRGSPLSTGDPYREAAAGRDTVPRARGLPAPAVCPPLSEGGDSY